MLALLLRSSLYVGKVTYSGNEYDGLHEPIVSHELFDEVQGLLEERRMMPPRTQHSPHLLSGIARCGKCGWRLRAHWQYHETKAGRKAYRSYQHRGTEFAGKRACDGFTKSAEKLEGLMIDKIRELAASEGFQEAAFEAAKAQLDSDLPAIRREWDEVSGELAGLAERFGRWAERLDRGQIDEEQFTTRNAELLGQKAKLQRRLAELDVRLAKSESVEVGVEQVQEMLRSFDTVWQHLTLDEQREMLRALIEELNLWRDRAELKLVLMAPVEIPLKVKRGPSGRTVEEP